MRNSIRTKLKGKPHKSRSEVYLINLKYMGDEPSFTDGHHLSESEIGKAYNWYNYMQTNDESLLYLKEWIKSKNITVPKGKWNHRPTSGWTARLLGRGYILPDGYEDRLTATVTDPLNYVVEEKEVTVSPTRISSSTSFIADIEDIVDARWTSDSFSMYNWLKGKEISRVNAQKILDYYKPILDEWMSTDKDIMEAYKSFSLKEKKASIAFFKSMIDDLNRFLDNKTRERKPRKKKTVSNSKIVQNFQYCVENTDLKIKSISPERILSSTEVWMFNPKYNMLTILRSPEGETLKVRNSFIEGLDELKSRSITLKKKEVISTVERILKGTKFSNKKLIENMKGNGKVMNRSTKDVILLRAY